ncbi:MAG TPA: nicotinate-nucleotide adenylyltransferase [Gemmatales bacterium]|nr:nicotinate-nucleotide adenylyltransferase [Gemmatales bacterium]HMP60290.1 nicotinate-nucleotide adenylyltransferase [Gemmatales bacterium]
MRIGILGGSFDPVHLGHLILAEQCREQAQLERVIFMLAPRPPHKLEQEQTSFHHRQEMLELALAGETSFEVGLHERDRPGPSYTVDTLTQLQRDHQEDELHLIVGGDTLADLNNWRDPAGIAERASLVVAGRPGAPTSAIAPPFRGQWVTMPLVEISSRDLRVRASEGRSIRYLVPRAVECYIQQHGLYGSQRS